jgi:hypothetical protein
MLSFHHIYIRQIDTPAWCLFYFTGPVLLRHHLLRQVVRPPCGIIVADFRSLDLLATLATSSVDLLVYASSSSSGR